MSYPALLAVGIPPLPANIANLVAGVAIAPGAALSSRRELAETRSSPIRLLPVVVVGTLLGAGLLLVTPPGHAIKNMLLSVMSLAAATVFVAIQPVPWSAVLPLAGGLLVGSSLGPIIVRHLPPSLVRWIAASFGFLLAVYLWLRPG